MSVKVLVADTFNNRKLVTLDGDEIIVRESGHLIVRRGNRLDVAAYAPGRWVDASVIGGDRSPPSTVVKGYIDFDRDRHCVTSAVSRIEDSWERWISIQIRANKMSVLFLATDPVLRWLVTYAEIETSFVGGDVAMAMKQVIGESRISRVLVDEHVARQTPMGWSRTIGSTLQQMLESVVPHDRWVFAGTADLVQKREILTGLLKEPTLHDPSQLRLVNCPLLASQLEWVETVGSPVASRNDELEMCLLACL